MQGLFVKKWWRVFVRSHKHPSGWESQDWTVASDFSCPTNRWYKFLTCSGQGQHVWLISSESHTPDTYFEWKEEKKKNIVISWVIESFHSSDKWHFFSALGLVKLLRLAESLVRTLWLFVSAESCDQGRVWQSAALPTLADQHNTRLVLLVSAVSTGCRTHLCEWTGDECISIPLFLVFLFEWALVHFTLIYLVCFAGSSSIALNDCSSVAY